MPQMYRASYTAQHTSIGRRLDLTEDQKRVIYLGGRRAREEQLADDWRYHFAGLFRPCDRCGYLGNKHAMWCPYTD
jgi:hypothetical protein